MANEQITVVEEGITNIVVIAGCPTLPFNRANAIAAYATRNPGWSRTQEPVVLRSPALVTDAFLAYEGILDTLLKQQREVFKPGRLLFVQRVAAWLRATPQPAVAIGLVTACAAASDEIEIRVVEGALHFV